MHRFNMATPLKLWSLTPTKWVKTLTKPYSSVNSFTHWASREVLPLPRSPTNVSTDWYWAGGYSDLKSIEYLCKNNHKMYSKNSVLEEVKSPHYQGHPLMSILTDRRQWGTQASNKSTQVKLRYLQKYSESILHSLLTLTGRVQCVVGPKMYLF